MLLRRFKDEVQRGQAADEALQLMREMFPLCRSITGNGVRQTLDLVAQRIPLDRTEVPSGTRVFDWVVPDEWNIRDAFVADSKGKRVVDFRASNLHVVSYSVPVNRTVSLDELQSHLHSMPEHPDWIPYRTSYYQPNWGFCLPDHERQRLKPGDYQVVVDSTLSPGSLTYAECVVPGESDGEAIVYTHTCHPSMANDNLSGIAVAAALAGALRSEQPRLTWRFIFGPGTIGSLVWLSRNEQRLRHMRAGLTIGLLGDAGPLTYKRTNRGGTITDRAGEYVLRRSGQPSRIVDFEPYGYDERQFCSPGFDLPVGRLSRASHGGFPEYHTSADDLSRIDAGNLAGSIEVLADLIAVIDANRFGVNLSPKGEPQLGKRGLYGSTGGGQSIRQYESALLWVLSQSDGRRDLLAIAERSGLEFGLLEQASTDLKAAGLVGEVEAAPSGAEVERHR